MSNKMWESLVEHAKTCVLSGKHYIYYSDETRSIGAVFNNIYEFIGLIANGQYYSAESLTDSQKVSIFFVILVILYISVRASGPYWIHLFSGTSTLYQH